MNIVNCDPTSDKLWADLVRSRDASVFHSPEWLRVVADTYGFTPNATVIEDESGPVAGLAWADLKDVNGHRRVCFPFCDYSGPVSESIEHTEALIREVNSEIDSNGQHKLIVRAFPEELPESFVDSGKVAISSWMGIDLEGTEEEVTARATAAARKGVRKAERNGVTAHVATDKGELREWFELHLKIRKNRHRLLAQPYEFFERIWDTFIDPGNGFLLLTMMDGKTVGGMFCLQQGDIVYTKFSASDEAAHKAKPNNLMYYETILEAKRRGARLIDMGRNPHSASGLIYFKKSFGAYEKDLYAVTVDFDRPSHIDHGALLKSLTELLVHDDVPDDVTERAGELLYKNFA